MGVAEFVNAELIRVWLDITAALSHRVSTVSNVMGDMCDGFPVEASSSTPGPSSGFGLARLRCFSFYDLFFLLTFGKCC